MLQPIYIPKADRPMRLALFGSGQGSNGEALISAAKQLKTFEVSVIFSDRKCPLHNLAQREGIPLIYHSYRQFAAEKPPTNKTRVAYDREIVSMLQPYSPDIIFLAGYMRLVSSPLLDKYKNRILNVHPADLEKVDASSERQYIGADAVRLALECGETKTRSTVIIVDEQVDGGPIVTIGPWVEYVEGETPQEHQAKQKKLSDRPAVIDAVKLIADGCVAVSQQNKCIVTKKPGESR